MSTRVTSASWLTWAVAQTQPTRVADSQCLGSLTLAPHQVDGANRLFQMASRFGGALLADATGLGKTRMALAAASRLRRQGQDPRPIVVCAPARVLPGWKSAIGHSGVADVLCVSHHQLSRGLVPEASVVIADEAHRFRNAGSQRARSLAKIAASAPVLLLTATPIANSVWDLYALLKTFLAEDDLRPLIGCDVSTAFEGSCRGEFDLTELLQHVSVRRVDVGREFKRPSARVRVLTYEPDSNEAWVWNHLEPTINTIAFELLKGDWPLGLLRDHILRRWEAGAQALHQTINYLAEFHERWLEVRASGGTLERSEFQTLFGESFRQGVLGFMFAPHVSPFDVRQIEADLQALVGLRTRLAAACLSGGMAAPIVALLKEDPGKLLVFTSFVAAAESLFADITRLVPDLSVGLLTGAGAQATGLGRVNPDELLKRFSPGSHGADALPSHQQVEVIVATDCISEGVNLQDCGRVVLGDLPHTPLTIEQRVGRLLRPGSEVDNVDVYLPRPINWNDTLGLRRRLENKMEHAQTAGTGYTTKLSGPSPNAPNPLRVLTDLDRLVGCMAPKDQQIQEFPAFARCVVQTEVAATVLIWEMTDSGQRACWLEALDSTGQPVPLVDVIADLVRTFEADLEVSEIEVSQVMRRRLVEREERIASSTFSPRALTLDSVQARAWATLGVVEGLDWEVARSKLLRPLTRGDEMWLERSVERGATAVAAWIQAREMPSDGTSVRLVGGLALRG